MIFLQVREKSGNFVDCQGKERTLEVREKSGNLKINDCGRQTRKFMYSVQEGERCTFS